MTATLLCLTLLSAPSPLAKKRKRESDSEDRSLWRTAKVVKTEQDMEPTSPVVINDDSVILVSHFMFNHYLHAQCSPS